MIQNDILAHQTLTVNSIFAQAIYVDDFEGSKDFYSKVLGMTVTGQEGSCGCFLGIGDNPQAIYLEGGHAVKSADASPSSVSFMMRVTDARQAFEDLREKTVRTVQDAPVEMGGGSLWFQFFDPSGNLLEMVSMP